MRYAYDTEFLEDGNTIELISIGIVAEDGREFYAVNRDFTWRRIAHRNWWAPWTWKVEQPWLAENVVPHLPLLHGDARLHFGNNGPLGLIDWQSPLMMSREQIADRVRKFLTGIEGATPELWADYCAYDHVVLCQLWGTMMDLPSGMPMFTNDLQQAAGARPEVQLPSDPEDAHNALADARHVMRSLRVLFDTDPSSRVT